MLRSPAHGTALCASSRPRLRAAVLAFAAVFAPVVMSAQLADVRSYETSYELFRGNPSRERFPVLYFPNHRENSSPRDAVGRRVRWNRASVGRLWKINTHLFAANIALKDALNDEMVTIPPFGEFRIAATALSALRAAPASYRAGVLAPDLFPDMYVGGWSIHSDLSQSPSEGWIADNWMRHVWQRARAWPDQSQRDRVMAFAYGFLTHAAGDMFAHTYVSRKADGAWVSGPDFPTRPHSTAIKHIVLEGYVGSRTPPTDLTLDVWPRFVAEVLIKDPDAHRHMFAAVHYRNWIKIYNWLGPQIDRAKRQMNNNIRDDAPYWAKCAANPVPCAMKEQMESWRLDIDRGMRALVEANQTLGEKLMDGETMEGVSAITNWANEWVPKMFGAHAVGEGAAAMQRLLDWIGDPLAPINEAIMAEVLKFLEQTFPAFYKLYQAVHDPALFLDECVRQLREIDACFPPGIHTVMDQDMGVSSSDGQLNWRQFEPLYNSVILSKLALLDGDGLNELVRRAGVNAELFRPGEETNIMLGVVRSMTQSFQWVGESVDSRDATWSWPPPDTIGPTKHGICGPEHEDTIPQVALCGIRQRDYNAPSGLAGVAATFSADGSPIGGFALWGHPEAREKIFRVIFKGYGWGPGSAAASLDAVDIGPARGGAREAARALGAVAEQVERMREAVTVMRAKISGVATVSVQPRTAVATPTAPPAQAPTTIGRGRRPPAQPPPVTPPPPKTEVPAAAVAADVETITNWGERCCSKDIAELRAALLAIQALSPRLQSSSVLNELGRREVGQLPSRSMELATAIDSFANARDADAATAALANISRKIEALDDAIL